MRLQRATEAAGKAVLKAAQSPKVGRATTRSESSKASSTAKNTNSTVASEPSTSTASSSHPSSANDILRELEESLQSEGDRASNRGRLLAILIDYTTRKPANVKESGWRPTARELGECAQIHLNTANTTVGGTIEQSSNQYKFDKIVEVGSTENEERIFKCQWMNSKTEGGKRKRSYTTTAIKLNGEILKWT